MGRILLGVFERHERMPGVPQHGDTAQSELLPCALNIIHQSV